MADKITWSQHSLDISLFKVGESYTRKEIRRKGSLPPNPGQQENWGGIVRLNNLVLIFVTLDKVNAKKEHLYNDYFEGEDFFWESQNKNTLENPAIKAIIYDDNSHLFIRVTSKVKNNTQPFTYAGRITPVDLNENVKPMQFQFECLDYQTEPNQILSEIYNWRRGTKLVPTTVANIDRPKRRKTVQGFQRDQAKKYATELRGMVVAREYYESLGFKVDDKSMLRGLGYDYLCTKGKHIIEVEVKSTTGSFGEVIITKNELDNARNSKNDTALFVVHGIEFDIQKRNVTGIGGEITILDNWLPKDSELTPLTFRYKINK